MTGPALTAAEYVAAIQHLEVRDRLSADDPGARPSKGNSDVTTAYARTWREVEDDPFLHSVRYLTDTIFGPFLGALPRSASRKLRGVAIGVAPIRTMNARCIRAVNGDPAVVFNPRVLTIVSSYVETQLDAAYLGDHAASVAEPLMNEAFRYLVEYFESDGHPRTSKRTLPKGVEEFSMMSAAAIGSELFAVAQALAHIYAGHLDRTKGFEVLFSSGDVLTLNFYEFAASQQCEADLIAWDWYRCAGRSVPVLGAVDPEWSESVPYTYLIASCLIDRNTGALDPYSAAMSAYDRFERFVGATVGDPQDRRALLEIGSTVPVTER